MPHDPDATYPRLAFPLQSPIAIAQACLSNGVAPPDLDPGFVYCDLGCGLGLSLTAFAAALPRGQFYGVDLLPQHIDAARSFAAASQLDNAHFMLADFLSLDPRNLPPCDVITLHGIMSWVPDPVRHAIARIVASRLKPGGALYLAYNAQPGWTLVRPLRDLLLHHLRDLPLSGPERAAEALRHLHELQRLDAPYLRQNPGAVAQVEELLRGDPDFLAHDLLNDTWEPLFFQQIIDLFADADLEYVGALPLHFNDVDLVVPERFRAAVEAAPDPIQRQTLRDVLCNDTFRRDVFVRRPAPRLSSDALSQHLSSLPLGTWARRAHLSKPLSFPCQDIAFAPEALDPILDVLCHRSASIDDLRALLPTHPDDVLFGMLYLLMAHGSVLPLDAPTTPAPPRAPDARLSIPCPFNRAQLARHLPHHPDLFHASSALGNVAPLPSLEAGLLRGLVEAGPEGALAWTRAWLSEAGAEVVSERGGDPLRDAMDRFDERLTKLVELGIVVADGPHPLADLRPT